ncbi:MAG: DUF3598 family protein [Gloeomargarita sp. SKYBB_i_bin120]|nr:DUF3598 family protein [Gloeomargarita sp. SKYG98]MCS7291556.1 DUF3598 family protein [Gloeomargarita sp. SKYB120]MDW8177116.1 DUF3598 family protein [Gloeomargarita sp. SKYBB_i_bin120]
MQPLPDYPSQWQCLLQNLGEWRGTFCDVSPTGECLSERPSLVTLEALDQGATIRQSICVDGHERVLVYRTLGRGILLFADGAFSNGSLQWGPFGEFGAELGLIWGDRRVRCAIVYHNSVLDRLTLIQEQRASTEPVPGGYPPVTQLYPDWRTPTALAGQLTLTWDGKTANLQADMETERWTWTGQRQGANCYEGQDHRLLQLQPDLQVFAPLVIARGRAFGLGLIWQGQALWRRYDERGAWTDLTQIRRVQLVATPGE